ncbi:MAG TPA: hypothetical protein VFQ70_03830 [Candidatus Saccharimonadaceae bacterium]|nr:hypothetical protein [Candidatus Saccharimonadaceae bacterium]
MDDGQDPNNSDQHSPEGDVVASPASTGSQRVIHPSQAFMQELQMQQQPVPPATSSSGLGQAPLPDQSVSLQQDTPMSGQMQAGMSASQMGWNRPKISSFNFKKLLVKSIATLVVLGGVFVALVFTNIIPINRFETVHYTSSGGASYSLSFYTDHTKKTLQSGTTELVSKVSKDGKFPLTLSIQSGPLADLNQNGIKTCDGPLPKAFDVYNDKLNQQISVCYLPVPNDAPPGVYVMGFAANGQANIVTISQDISGTGVSSRSSALKSASEVGIGTYQGDIKQIVASIVVE